MCIWPKKPSFWGYPGFGYMRIWGFVRPEDMRVWWFVIYPAAKKYITDYISKWGRSGVLWRIVVYGARFCGGIVMALKKYTSYHTPLTNLHT